MHAGDRTFVATVAVFTIAAVVVMAIASYQPDEWKVIQVCDRAPKTVPAESAHTIKEGSEKDCGIYQRFRDSQLMRNWHPMFIAPLLGDLGFPGHENARHEFPVRNGALVHAPVTSCWNYDFLEKDCDGPDHYKALVEGTKIGAYKGDPSLISPKRAKACATTSGHQRYCVKDLTDDGKTIWRDTHHRIVEHTLSIGCPGVHIELPCKSKD